MTFKVLLEKNARRQLEKRIQLIAIGVTLVGRF